MLRFIIITLLIISALSFAEWKDLVLLPKLAVDGGIEHKQGDVVKIIWNIEKPGELCIKKNGETIMCLNYIEGSGSMDFDTSTLKPGPYSLYIHDDNNTTIADTLLVIETSSASLEIKPSPNPFDLSSGSGTMVFDGMPPNSTLRIYDFSGSLVYKTENNNLWDGRNLNGELVSAGAYIFHIEYKGGEYIGRFAVVK
jgi:hypothetical protein